jgi:repressor LexA
MALTRRQKELMEFIVRFVEDHGYSPSYEEMARGLSLNSLATVHKHVLALESKDYLRRGFNQSRSVEISDRYVEERQMYARAQAGVMELPLAGRIAAGAPVEALESSETLNFADFVSSDRTFALQVRGDSMVDDHICDGDYVLIERTQQVRDGEIIVALVRGAETTLKRFYREPGEKVRLQPANAAMQPIFVPASEIEIQGRVLAVLRKYK